jgi:sulfatase modifying factor 1
MRNNPSRFKGGQLPVDEVSWFDAVAYCNRLSQLLGLEEAYVLSDVSGKPGKGTFKALSLPTSFSPSA